MKLEEIRAIAKQHDIKTGRMKKAELIRAIQESEGNAQCFETGQAERCGQMACLWRSVCN